MQQNGFGPGLHNRPIREEVRAIRKNMRAVRIRAKSGKARVEKVFAGFRQARARGRSGLAAQQVTAVAKEPRPVVHGLNERVLKGTLHLNIGPDRPNG